LGWENRYSRYLKRQEDAESHMQFPDEVDTPHNIPARIRFQRYRGLKSFRTSPWDPYENLPSDYGRIFQFQDFNRTRARAFASTQDGGIPVGSYVTVYVDNVPSRFASKSCFVFLFGFIILEVFRSF